MDSQRDGKSFRELMKQFHAVYREGFDASDEWLDAMWNSLKDVSFAELKANAQRLMATAAPGTPLPRPAQLRNRPAPTGTKPPSFEQEKAERDSVRRWSELKKRDPIVFEIEWRSSRAFTCLAQCDEADPDHEEWLREYRKWDRLRYVARAEQESAVKQVLGQT